MVVKAFKNLFLTPYGILLLSVSLSAIAWMMPSFGIINRGFLYHQHFEVVQYIGVVVWYLPVLLLAFIGYQIGKFFSIDNKFLNDYANILDNKLYVIISLVSLFAGVYIVIFLFKILGSKAIILAFTEKRVDLLKKALYSDYHIGIFSLRYVAILSASITFFRFYKKIFSHKLLVVANIINLLFMVTMSSRLSLIICIIIFLGLILLNQKDNVARFNKKTFFYGILFFTTILLLLFLANYYRNYDFYHDRGLGFFGGGISQIVAYLAAPFQVSIYAGNNLSTLLGSNWNTISQYANVQADLTTNSAFFELLQNYGIVIAFLLSGLTAFSASFVMGILRKQNENYLALVYLVLLYCFADFWRIFVFYKGITITLISIAIFIAFLSIFFKVIFNKGLTAAYENNFQKNNS